MTRPEPLPDLWHRDLLVLREIARRAETMEEPMDVDSVADTLQMDRKVVGMAGKRLQDDGYLAPGTYDEEEWGVLYFGGITGKALREVGQWPSPESAADRLVTALRAAVDQAPEGPEKTKRRRALDAVLGLGRDVLVGVSTNIITGQIPT